MESDATPVNCFTGKGQAALGDGTTPGRTYGTWSGLGAVGESGDVTPPNPPAAGPLSEKSGDRFDTGAGVQTGKRPEMKLYRGALYALTLNGSSREGRYLGTVRGLCVLKLPDGRKLRLHRRKVGAPIGNSHHDRAPTRRVPLKRESKTKGLCSRLHWASWKPGTVPRAKDGTAKPVLSCQCQLCGGTK